jgi:hypothetical protein
MFGADNFLDVVAGKGGNLVDVVGQHRFFCKQLVYSCKLLNVNTPRTYSIKNEGSLFSAGKRRIITYVIGPKKQAAESNYN